MYLGIVNGSIAFKVEGIHVITENDVEIEYGVYQRFLKEQEEGKQFRIKDINGWAFEEIFEEYISEKLPHEPSEVELLKEQLATIQGALDFIIMNY